MQVIVFYISTLRTVCVNIQRNVQNIYILHNASTKGFALNRVIFNITIIKIILNLKEQSKKNVKKVQELLVEFYENEI